MVLRIGGFASGMDIDSIVTNLIKAERIPLDSIYQKKKVVEWQRDMYRDMNTKLASLRDEIFKMSLSSNLDPNIATSSDESKLSVKGTASAGSATYTISAAKKASAAYNISTDKISGGSLDPTKSLWESRASFGNLDFSEVGEVWKEGAVTQENITVTSDQKVFKLAKGAINPTSIPQTMSVIDQNGIEKTYNLISDKSLLDEGQDQFFVDEKTGELTFSHNISKDSTIKGFEYKHYYFEFSITSFDEDGNPIDEGNGNGTYDFKIDGTASFNDLMKSISNSTVGVSAFYDSVTDKVMFTRKSTGDLNVNGKEIGVTSTFLTSVLRMDESKEVGGTDASITINGLTTTRKSNTFDIGGVTYNIKSDFTSSDPAISVTLNRDIDKSVDNIKSFVNKYNEIIGEINKTLSEERYRDFPPLTDEQKKELSDKEVEMWEEKAKSGLLRGDSILEMGLNRLRSDLYSTVNSTNSSYTHLTNIGISTTSNWKEKGKLAIDENKLREALANDPQAVANIFQGNGNIEGIAKKMTKTIDETVEQINKKAGKNYFNYSQYSLGSILKRYDDKINKFEDRLVDLESRYWRQFSEMEKAIDKSNQQSAALMGQLGY